LGVSNTTKKNTEALIEASKEVGVEVNTEKSEHVLMAIITRILNKIIT
jgi:hypothetical protein